MILGLSPFALAFGVVLGLGFLTVIVCLEYYAIVFAVVAVGPSAWSGVIAMTAFGVGRACPMWATHICVSRRGASHATGGTRRCVQALQHARRPLAIVRYVTLMVLLGSMVVSVLI